MNLESRMAIDPFGKRKGRGSEVIGSLDIVKDEDMDLVMDCYKGLRTLNDMRQVVLSPAKIHALLNMIQQDNSRRKFEFGVHILRTLIHESYRSGYNDFLLELEDGMSPVTYELKGDEEPLRLMIKGEDFHSIGSCCSNCIFDIDSDVTVLGDYAWDSVFNVKGNVYKMGNSTRCEFNIEGDVDNIKAFFGRNVYNIKGDLRFIGLGSSKANIIGSADKVSLLGDATLEFQGRLWDVLYVSSSGNDVKFKGDMASLKLSECSNSNFMIDGRVEYVSLSRIECANNRWNVTDEDLYKKLRGIQDNVFRDGN